MKRLLALLAFVSSLPLGLAGVVVLIESRAGGGAGPMRGLSAVGEVVGVAMMIAAALAMAIGGYVFIRD